LPLRWFMIKTTCMMVRRVKLPILFAIALTAAGIVTCLGQGTEAEILGFSCSNQPLSEGLSLLSKESPIPINCIVDEMEEPRVTVDEPRATVSTILLRILSSAPNYRFISRDGAILVLPEGLETVASFPLNRVQSRFEVTYNAYTNRNGEQVYVCTLPQPELKYLVNVSMPNVFFKHKPSALSFPSITVFTNRSIRDILTAISVETRLSWSCGRVRGDYIRWYNKRLAQSTLPDVRTWWPNENAPGYAIRWGKGAFHGEYAYTTEITDEQGKVRLKGITVQEVEEKEAKAQEETERALRFDAVRQQVVRGMQNKEPSPVQVQAAISTTVTSNHTTAVALTLTITNTTTNDVRFSNPYLGVLQQAFWDVRVDMKRAGYEAQYQMVVPSTGQTQEPSGLLLAPQAAMTRVLEIFGAQILRDDTYSNQRFPGDPDEKLNRPGKYSLFARLYFRKAAGEEYCVWSGPVDFEIK
jgi:hypothetical protein